MIRKIEMENFEGIASGTLDELTPLVVLVGPNGSGKSGVLDAIGVAESAAPETGVAWAQSKRAEVPDAWRWMIHRPMPSATSRVTSTLADGSARTVELKFLQRTSNVGVKPGPNVRQAVGCETIDTLTTFNQRTLHELFSSATEQGRLVSAEGMLRRLVPGLERLALLTASGTSLQPVVHLAFSTHSVPLGVAGQGIYALARLALMLATSTGGVALIEEPETRLHPGAIRQAAEVLVGATAQTQIILSTHSLELIDALVDALPEADVGRLTVFQLRLDDGVLKASRIEGGSVRFMRHEMERDLR